MYWWWCSNIWRSKGRRLAGEGEGADPWMGRWLFRDGELLLLLQRAANGGTPRANNRDTLLGAWQARSSTTRHGTATVQYGEEGECCTARAPFRPTGALNSNLRSSHSVDGRLQHSNQIKDSETLLASEIFSRAYFLLRIATRSMIHQTRIRKGYSRNATVPTRNRARTCVACWSILNFTPSRKLDRRWGALA